MTTWRRRGISFGSGVRQELKIKLTEMLAWVADRVPGVRTCLVDLVVGDLASGQGAEFRTQDGIVQGRLDLLISSPALALVVESKLDSGYGDGQLGKYLHWLKDEFWRATLAGARNADETAGALAGR